MPFATQHPLFRMEPHIVDRTRGVGWIEVICGSMFSGKTEELIRRLRRARIAQQHTEVFKPALDNRFSAEEAVSHDENVISTTPVHAASQIILLAQGADVVGVDEAQFFGLDLVDVCQQLANDGMRVIVAGLDQDYQGQPFEPIPQLMAVAEHVTKLHAICKQCGAPANHSQRLVRGGDRVLIGAKETYEPRCRRCFDPALSAEDVSAEDQAPAPADEKNPSASDTASESDASHESAHVAAESEAAEATSE